MRNQRRTLGIASTLAMLVGGILAAPVQATTLLLPDLAPLAPFDFSVDTTTAPGHRLLRFSTVVVNIGAGDFRLQGYAADGTAAIGDTLNVRQLIRRSDGTWMSRETGAHMVYASDGHNHWHIIGGQKFKLVDLKLNYIHAGAKVGFCFLDSYPWTSTLPDRYNSHVSICNLNQYGNVRMGTSRNWGDIYRYDLAFQWIDITNVPDGDYQVRFIADPPFGSGGRFIETRETNNRSWANVRIAGTKVTLLTSSPTPT